MQSSEDYVPFEHIFLLTFSFISMKKLLPQFLSSLTTIIGPKAKSKFANAQKMHCNVQHNNAGAARLLPLRTCKTERYLDGRPMFFSHYAALSLCSYSLARCDYSCTGTQKILWFILNKFLCQRRRVFLYFVIFRFSLIN